MYTGLKYQRVPIEQIVATKKSYNITKVGSRPTRLEVPVSWLFRCAVKLVEFCYHLMTVEAAVY